jgi:L-seryl-tRNA(Ser) seleniumtransferase
LDPDVETAGFGRAHGSVYDGGTALWVAKRRMAAGLFADYAVRVSASGGILPAAVFLHLVSGNLVMGLPPWTRGLARELMSGSLDDVANRLKEAVSRSELSSTAARGLERVLRETRRGADQLRGWARRQTAVTHAALNGSGEFFHPVLRGVPLGEEVLNAWFPAEGLSESRLPQQRERITRQLETELQHATGRGALMARGVEAAVVAVAGAMAGDGALAVPRCTNFRPDGGPPLTELLAASGVELCEVGTGDDCAATDWEAVLGRGRIAGVVDVRWPSAASRTAIALPDSLVGGRDCRRIGIEPWGTLRALEAPLDDCGRRLDARSLAEDWVTIVPTHRLLHGPPGALILGMPESLRSIAAMPIWSALRADLGTEAALTRALQQSVEGSSYLQRLLRTSTDNLQNRCERLATQLVGSPAVANCQITRQPARLSAELKAEIPSRQLVLQPAAGDPQPWSDLLLTESPALLTRVDSGMLVIDLRFLPPRHDELLAALLGSAAARETDPAT